MILLVSIKGIPFLGPLEHFAESHLFGQPLDLVRSFGRELYAYRLHIEGKFVQDRKIHMTHSPPSLRIKYRASFSRFPFMGGGILSCQTEPAEFRGSMHRAPELPIALIQVATRIGADFYNLTLLQLVNTDRIHTFDFSRTIAQRRAAQATGLKVLDLVETVIQYVGRL